LPQDQGIDGDLPWHQAQTEKSWQSKGETNWQRRHSPLTKEPNHRLLQSGFSLCSSCNPEHLPVLHLTITCCEM
jgi:hypothetical protein